MNDFGSKMNFFRKIGISRDGNNRTACGISWKGFSKRIEYIELTLLFIVKMKFH